MPRRGYGYGLTATRGGGSSAPSSSFYQGWNATKNFGTSADYIIASDGSGDFTTLTAAIAQIVSDGASGKHIAVKDLGSDYRETVDFTGVSGSSGSRLRITGYGTQKPRFSAQDVLSGLTQCTSADQSLIGDNYASIYKTTLSKANLPYSAFVALNICEAKRQLQIATDRADTSDLFWAADTSTFHQADAFGLVDAGTDNHITSITDATVFENHSQTVMENAFVVVYGDPNTTEITKVTAFDVGTNVATVEKTLHNVQGNTGTPAATDLLYSLINAVDSLTEGTWAFYDDGGDDITVYVWPKDAANVAAGITYAARNNVFDIANAAHVEIAGLKIHGTSGDTIIEGVGIFTTDTAGDIYIHDCYLSEHANIYATSYGAIFFKNGSNLRVDNNTIEYCQSGFGVFFEGTSPEAINTGTLNFNKFRYTGKAAARIFGSTNIQVCWNDIDQMGREAHANVMNAYLGCSKILFGWNKCGANAFGYITWQEAGDIAIIGNLLSDSGTAITGGGEGRAIADQLHSSGTPPYTPSKVWVIGNTVAPKSTTLGALAASITIAGAQAAAQGQTTVCVNNVCGGISWSNAGQVDEEKRNYIYRLPNGYNAGNYDASDTVDDSIEKIFENYAGGDYRPPAGSPVLMATAEDVTSLKATFAAIWDGVDWDHLVDAYGKTFTLDQVGATTMPVADANSPVLSGLAGTADQLVVSGSVNTTEGRGTLYAVLVGATDDAPTAASILANPDVTKVITATGSQSFSLTGDAAGDFKLYAVHKDLAGNISTVASSDTITLTDFTATYQLFNGSAWLTRGGAFTNWPSPAPTKMTVAITYIHNVTGGTQYIAEAYGGINNFLTISIGTTNKIDIKIEDNTDTIVWRPSPTLTFVDGGEYLILISVDTSSGGSRTVIINPATGATYANGTATDADTGEALFAPNSNDFMIGNAIPGSVSSPINGGELERFQIWFGTALDLTDEGNLGLFVDRTSGGLQPPSSARAVLGTALVDIVGTALQTGANAGGGGDFQHKGDPITSA
jgi:hypothetical protein